MPDDAEGRRRPACPDPKPPIAGPAEKLLAKPSDETIAAQRLAAAKRLADAKLTKPAAD